jgi:hypothetical protein
MPDCFLRLGVRTNASGQAFLPAGLDCIDFWLKELDCKGAVKIVNLPLSIHGKYFRSSFF